MVQLETWHIILLLCPNNCNYSCPKIVGCVVDAEMWDVTEEGETGMSRFALFNFQMVPAGTDVIKWP